MRYHQLQFTLLRLISLPVIDIGKVLVLTCVYAVTTLSTNPAAAISYPFYLDREIIQKAEIVIQGTVTQVIAPPDVAEQKKDAVSVAVIRVDQVFKGELMKGDEIRLVYWSHDVNPPRFWGRPSKYDVGEVLMLPLTQKREDHFASYLSPKEAETAPWVNRFRGVYEKQVQSKQFLRVAEIWGDPAKKLDDPTLRDDAVFFLAHRKQLPEDYLLGLLNSPEVADQRIGTVAAIIVESHQALEPLVRIIETRKWTPAFHLSSLEHERERQSLINRLILEAKDAIHKLPIQGDKDGPVLLRLALCGGMTDKSTAMLLHAGEARWMVRKGLLKSLQDQPTVAAVQTLQRLDARAAYDWVKLLATDKNVDIYREAALLVNEYDTLWAMRYVLVHAHEPPLPRGIYDDHEQYSYVRDSFGFTHKSVIPYDRREDAGKGKDNWKTLYAELRTYAQEELAITEKKGPSFDRLPTRLERIKRSEVHVIGERTFVTLNEAPHDQLMQMIIQHSDESADKLYEHTAPAVWLIDLHNPDHSRLPLGQLWIAGDGTFGLSWLPDRTWGKSEELVAWLKELESK